MLYKYTPCRSKQQNIKHLENNLILHTRERVYVILFRYIRIHRTKRLLITILRVLLFCSVLLRSDLNKNMNKPKKERNTHKKKTQPQRRACVYAYKKDKVLTVDADKDKVEKSRKAIRLYILYYPCKYIVFFFFLFLLVFVFFFVLVG